MLIQALCEYYDILEKDGKTTPEGYSEVNIKYLIKLHADGTFDPDSELVDKNTLFPKRVETTKIEANIVEHRASYIFGMICEKKQLTINKKASNQHKAFVEKNLDFIKDIDSPIVNAYRNFILNWDPEVETDNELVKKINNKNCAFCLASDVTILLNEDEQIKEKFIKEFSQKDTQYDYKAQCAIYGKELPIARLHDNIKGIRDAQSSGANIVSYNADAFTSYGYEQSYNSNISELAMQKYTHALNYIISNGQTEYLDGLSMLYWATSSKNTYVDLFSFLINPNKLSLDEASTSNMIKSLLEDVCSGSLNYKQLNSISEIDPNVSFYILGIKPNASRLSIAFLYRQKFGELLQNIAQHQKDMQISNDNKVIPVWRIIKELKSPKAREAKTPDAYKKSLLDSIILGLQYPKSILAQIIIRIKTDSDKKDEKGKTTSHKINKVRAGMIKACLNRNSRLNHKEEEITMALNTENKDPAYLCGRLLAILEKIQLSAQPGLNRTIVDSYFSTATTKPDAVFPKLIKLSQFHLRKLSDGLNIWFEKQLGDVLDSLDGQFPGRLSLQDQGKFILGYYQQREVLFAKKDKDEDNDILEGETENDQ